MANLLGSPFRKYVNETVTTRQRVSGLTDKKLNYNPNSPRSLEVISALNSRNAWVKLASSVVVEPNRLDILKKNYVNNPLIDNVNPGIDLAIQNVLQGGLVSKGTDKYNESSLGLQEFDSQYPETWRETVNNSINFSTDHRSGILGYSANPAYGVGGLDFGYSPMPGIVDMDITDLNRGSIKKSKLNIKCHNRAQFDVIDVLYLRLGYTVCLEWGWNQYIDVNNETGEIYPVYLGNTLIDDEFWKIKNEEYSDFLEKIENKRKLYKGNYDGIIGVISNFSWDFQPDGTYDVRLEITSLGDVIESLKVNLPPLVKSKNDPYAESRFKELLDELKSRATTEDEFYNVLYPGLRDELSIIYDSLNQYVENNIPIFSFTSTSAGNFIDVNKLIDNPHLLCSLDQSINIPPIRWENVANVNGIRDRLSPIVGDKFDWGHIFGANPVSLGGRYAKGQLGPDVSNIRGEDSGDHIGSINSNSWTLYKSPSDANIEDLSSPPTSAGKVNAPITVTATDTSIVYKKDGKWQRSSFLRSKTLLYSTLTGYESTDYEFPQSVIQSFDEYFLIGWTSPTKEVKNLNYIGGLLGDFKWFGDDNEVTWLDLLSRPVDSNKSLFAYYEKPQFLTLFYNWATFNGYAGGKGDDLIQGANEKEEDDNELSDRDKELSQQILEFKNSTERSKFKNKMNNYFFNVRDLHADSTYNLKIYDPVTFFDPPDDGDDDGLVLNDGTLIGDYRTYGTYGSEEANEDFTNMGALAGDKYITLRGPKFKATSTQNGKAYIDKVGAALNFITDWNSDISFPTYPYSGDGLFKDEIGKHPIDFFKLDLQPIRDSYFIRFKVLLNFINDFLIPKKKTKSTNQPIIQINTKTKTNICYTIDNVISVNPRKVVIKNSKFYTNQNSSQKNIYEKIYPELETFHVHGGEGKEAFRYGQIMNVYFNFNRVEEIFDSVDKNNQVSLFTVLKSLCDDINESLGSINNIEPVINKDLNEIQLIDQTSIPNLEIIRKSGNLGELFKNDSALKELQTPIEVFGYSTLPGFEGSAAFTRNVGITTEISKNYATAITIGATANGEVPGMESTAFSRWNIGLVDRFKENLTDGENKTTEPTPLNKSNEQIISNYKSFINSGYTKLGFSEKNQDLTINGDYISTNKNVVKNFYSYTQAETTLQNYDSGSNQGIIESSLGFLPINLKIDMDGLGGIRIYDFVKINTSFLPSNYPQTLEFICTGVNHKLVNNDWVTSLKTIATYTDKGSKSTSATS